LAPLCKAAKIETFFSIINYCTNPFQTTPTTTTMAQKCEHVFIGIPIVEEDNDINESLTSLSVRAAKLVVQRSKTGLEYASHKSKCITNYISFNFVYYLFCVLSFVIEYNYITNLQNQVNLMQGQHDTKLASIEKYLALPQAGYTSEEFASRGWNYIQAHAAGFTLSEIHNITFPKPLNLKSMGYSVQEAKVAGYTPRQLIDYGGYSPYDFKIAELSAQDFCEAWPRAGSWRSYHNGNGFCDTPNDSSCRIYDAHIPACYAIMNPSGNPYCRWESECRDKMAHFLVTITPATLWGNGAN
jgi:hypothetical protein